MNDTLAPLDACGRDTIHIAFLSALLRDAESAGYPISTTLKRLGIDRVSLEAEDIHVPVHACTEVWQQLRHETGDPNYGLALATRAQAGALYLVDLVLQSAESVRAAIHLGIETLGRLTTSMPFVVRSTADGGLCIEVRPGNRPQQGDFFEAAFAVLIARLRAATGKHWFPHEVRLRDDNRPASPLRAQFFGSNVRCSASTYSLQLGPSVCDMPIRSADARTIRIVRDHIERTAPVLGFVATVARITREGVEQGSCEIAYVAKRAGTSVRTLQRRLSEEGTNFAKLLDDARRDCAADWLRAPHARVNVVAYSLGFAAAGALSRAFQRWHGVSPREFQRQSAKAAPVRMMRSAA